MNPTVSTPPDEQVRPIPGGAVATVETAFEQHGQHHTRPRRVLLSSDLYARYVREHQALCTQAGKQWSLTVWNVPVESLPADSRPAGSGDQIVFEDSAREWRWWEVYRWLIDYDGTTGRWHWRWQTA